MSMLHRISVMVFLLGSALAQAESVDVQAVLQKSFVAKGSVGIERLKQDELQRVCTSYAGKTVPAKEAERLQSSQLQTIQKPASGKLLGDWRAGEKLAQEGRGLQTSDPADGPRGGNCYACHQITKQEIAFGNIGPSLLGYGKTRGYADTVVEYTYNKIYNSNAYQACSNMPRFGYQQILTPEQIADLTALLLDPASPVNQ